METNTCKKTTITTTTTDRGKRIASVTIYTHLKTKASGGSVVAQVRVPKSISRKIFIGGTAVCEWVYCDVQIKLLLQGW